MQTEKQCQLNGMEVSYDSYGEGARAFIFLHGLACDRSFWRSQEPVFSTYRSLAIDLLGHGRSGLSSGRYPPEIFARSIEAVCETEGVSKAIVVGHSFGGAIACTFARLNPSRILGIVLVDAYPYPGNIEVIDTESERRRRSALADFLASAEGELDFRDRMERTFSRATPPAVRAEIRRARLGTSSAVRIACVSSEPELPYPNRYELANVPSIAIVAAPASAEGLMRLRHAFGPIEVSEWRGHGHYLMLEDPARFNRELLSFCAYRSIQVDSRLRG